MKIRLADPVVLALVIAPIAIMLFPPRLRLGGSEVWQNIVYFLVYLAYYVVPLVILSLIKRVTERDN